MDSSAVAVIVATFGDPRWAQMARTVAAPSAAAQHPGELRLEHAATLAEARNAGAAATSAPWLCFLDADDELEPGYLAELTAGSGDLRAPAVRYVTAGEPEPEPISLAGRNISTMNPCVIGTLVPRDLFDRAGRFWTEPAWEDWSLFRRCALLGATIVHHPGAVYRVNVSPTGRNSTIPNPTALHRQIRQAHARWISLERRKARPR